MIKQMIFGAALVTALTGTAWAQQGAGHTAPKAQPNTAPDATIAGGDLALGSVSIPKALKADGKWSGTLYRSDYGYESPYNTYLHEGLPPGPIGNPGLAAIQAAASPAKTDFLYFVADGAGGHTFSRTFEEHRDAIASSRRPREEAPPAGAGDARQRLGNLPTRGSS